MISKYCEGEKIDLGNGTAVIPYGFYHKPETFIARKESILKTIQSSDFVVSEAAPYEDNRNEEDFFQLIARETWKARKNLLYVDNLADPTYHDLQTLLIEIPATIVGLIQINRVLLNIVISRRILLKNIVTLATSAAIFDCTPTGRAVINAIGKQCADTPYSFADTNLFSEDDARNSGAVVGMISAARAGLVEGNGSMFVGTAHLRHLVSYGKRAQAAYDALNMNLYQKGFTALKGVPQVTLWAPTQEEFRFDILKQIPLLPAHP